MLLLATWYFDTDALMGGCCMILNSEAYARMIGMLLDCNGRLVMMHEGGTRKATCPSAAMRC